MGILKTITVGGVSYELSPKVVSGGGLMNDETKGLSLYLSYAHNGLEIFKDALQVKVASGGGLKISEIDGGLAVDTMYSDLYIYNGRFRVKTQAPIATTENGIMVDPDWVLDLVAQYLKVNEDGSLSKK